MLTQRFIHARCALAHSILPSLCPYDPIEASSLSVIDTGSHIKTNCFVYADARGDESLLFTMRWGDERSISKGFCNLNSQIENYRFG